MVACQVYSAINLCVVAIKKYVKFCKCQQVGQSNTKRQDLDANDWRIKITNP